MQMTVHNVVAKVYSSRDLKQTKNNLHLNWDSISTNQAYSIETTLTIICNRNCHYSSTLTHFCSTFGEGTAGMTANRVPGTRAGLKERSQSAYAAPSPKPVDRATGQVRPNKCDMIVSRLSFPCRRPLTPKEDHRSNYAHTKSYTSAQYFLSK